MKSQVIADALDCIEWLEKTPMGRWAERFVKLKMWFMRKHASSFVFSTGHGIDFFHNVVACARDGVIWKEECEQDRPGKKKEKSELGDSFRKFISELKD